MGLRNYSKSSMSSAGKRKINLMMGDLVLSSGPSTARIRNSINFLVAYASGVVVSSYRRKVRSHLYSTPIRVCQINRITGRRS